jgi:hypothetical protein
VSRAKSWREVLCYSAKVVSRATVRRRYNEYRTARGIPRRCDNEGCLFHSQPVDWNGVALPLTLDHINGVARDSRPENLPSLSELRCTAADAWRKKQGARTGIKRWLRDSRARRQAPLHPGR